MKSRLSLDGYGARRAGSFAGKVATVTTFIGSYSISIAQRAASLNLVQRSASFSLKRHVE